MKIALLTDGIFPYVIGGMQRHSFYLAKYLAGAGHQVDLYHTNQSELEIHQLDVFTEEEKKNIRAFVIEFPSLGSLPGHYIKESYEYSRRIWNVFKKQAKADFIYVKGFSGWELLNRKKMGEQLPPVGVNFHGYEMFQPAPSFKEKLKYTLLLRPPVKFCVQHADYLFSYGGKITQLIRELGVADKRILEIPAGIDPSWLVDRPAPSDKKRRFVFVGRYERRKGLPELYKQLRLLDRSLEFKFTFVGDIPNGNRLAGDRFHYEGKVTDTAKLQTLLSNAEVLVCPSFSEGMPNVILEAMARGLAVIATDVGAVRVAVNEQNGWLLPPGDGAALKKALEEACNTPAAMLQAKREAALADARNKFQWPAILEQTVAKISAVIAQNP